MNVVLWSLTCAAFCSVLLVNQQVQATDTVRTSTAVRCFREDSKKCVIVKLPNGEPSQEILLPPLAGKSTLQIKQGNLSAFSEELANQLGTVEKLQIGQLQLKKLFLKPTLVEVSAQKNHIDTVEFQAGEAHFQLQVLDLRANKLNTLDGFDKLVNLRVLHLEDNLLETIDLNVFKGMKLEQLFLDRNAIRTITAIEPIELPNLEYFFLSGNQIRNLDISKWQLDSLTKWDVSTNMLIRIEGELGEQFPGLQMISVAKNAWQCKWLEDTLQLLSENLVVVQDRDEDCQGISPANICCVAEFSIDLTNDAQLNELKKLENDQKLYQVSFENKFGKLKVNNDLKLNGIDRRLKELQESMERTTQMSDDPNQSPNHMISKFVSIKEAVNRVKSSSDSEQQLWTEQQRKTNSLQHKAGYKMVELKQSLEQNTKLISKLQAQFESLQDLVRNALKNREHLLNW